MTGGPIDRISTHVLDTSVGRPAAGIEVTLFFLDAADVGGTAGERVGAGRHRRRRPRPGARCRPRVPAGNYRLVFDTVDYFTSACTARCSIRASPSTFFLDGARGHYHVPVLASLYSYYHLPRELTAMAIVLGKNQYGKAEVRLVHVDRSTPRHVITDVNVTSQLIGDFADTHLTGANDRVIATDTQKNTVYALARTGGVTDHRGVRAAAGPQLRRHLRLGHRGADGDRADVLGPHRRPQPARTTIPSSRPVPRSGRRWCARTATPRR